MDSNIIHLDHYINEGSGSRGEGTFSLPADGLSDKISLEWAFAPKDTTTVSLESFNDLVMKRHFAIASTGGIKGIAAYTASTTGYANVNTEEEVDHCLINNTERADSILKQMQEVYGEEKMQAMKPAELYKAYKEFAVSSHWDLFMHPFNPFAI